MICIDCGVQLLSPDANSCRDCYEKRMNDARWVTAQLCSLLRNQEIETMSKQELHAKLIDIVDTNGIFDKYVKDSQRK